MTKGFIAGVDLGESPAQYRIEKHRTETDGMVYQLIDSNGIEEFGSFAELIADVMYWYPYLKPDEYAALYALLDAQ